MRIQHNIYVAILVLIFSVTVFCGSLFNYGLSKVSNDSTLKKILMNVHYVIV